MKGEKYHHGNLKNKLVETGIEIINQESIETLSLRKVAEKCGVSNAAPYAHFKNKEDFVLEMYRYVEQKFCAVLEETVQHYPHDLAILPKMGETYVHFFMEHPHYYYFLFSKQEIEINLALDELEEQSNQPLAIFKKITLEVLTNEGMEQEAIQNKLIAMWAMVHGLANIVTLSDANSSIDWNLKISEIIQSLYIL